MCKSSQHPPCGRQLSDPHSSPSSNISMDHVPLLERFHESHGKVIAEIDTTRSSLSELIGQSREETLQEIERRFSELSTDLASRLNAGLSTLQRPLQETHSFRTLERGQDTAVKRLANSRPVGSIDGLFLSSASSKAGLSTAHWNNPPFAQCKSVCVCQCHSRSPSVGGVSRGVRLKLHCWQRVFGRATLDYFGVLTRWMSCNDRNCHYHRAGEVVRFHYQFPAWLLNIAVCLYFSTQLLGTPELLLRVYNTIPPDSATISKSIIGFARRGDFQGVESMLREGRGSVYDIDADHKRSSLHYAIERNSIPLVQLLFQAGADLFQQDYNSYTPIQLAVQRFENGRPWGIALSEILPVREVIGDEDMYTVLHRIILGLLPLDLEKELKKPSVRALLEVHSWTGRTPLNMAATRGDVRAVAVLLTAGAKVPAPSPTTGRQAIHEAAAAGCTEIIGMLIQRGCDINARTNDNSTALHIAACYSETAEPVALLLEHGADVGALNRYQTQPLYYAIGGDRIEMVNLLLDCGADMDHCDVFGDTLLTWSISYEAPGSSRLLLSRGADYTVINPISGRNVLHWLALNGSVESMRIFTQVEMRGVDVGRVDNTGKTPRQVFEERPGMGEGVEFLALREAFNGLMASVKLEPEIGWGRDYDSVEDLGTGSGSDEDDFLDAVEDL